MELKPDVLAPESFIFLSCPFSPPRKQSSWSCWNENRKSPLQKECLGCEYKKFNKIFFHLFWFEGNLIYFSNFLRLPATSTLKKSFSLSLTTENKQPLRSVSLPTRATIYLMRFIPSRASALLRGQNNIFFNHKKHFRSFPKVFLCCVRCFCASRSSMLQWITKFPFSSTSSCPGSVCAWDRNEEWNKNVSAIDFHCASGVEENKSLEKETSAKRVDVKKKEECRLSHIHTQWD